MARSARTILRGRMPAVNEFVYDHYYALVIGYGPNERPSDAIFSLVIYPRHVSLCFLFGAELADPDKVLQGNGHIVRHVRLTEASDLERPVLRALIDRAIRNSDVPLRAGGRGRLIIREAAAKQRPRRPRVK